LVALYAAICDHYKVNNFIKATAKKMTGLPAGKGGDTCHWLKHFKVWQKALVALYFNIPSPSLTMHTYPL
jgi:hypothetical protein